MPHLVMVRTVLVTPTRLVISPPQQEPSNSVTRRYKDKIDAVIRVQFADEEDKLFVSETQRIAKLSGWSEELIDRSLTAREKPTRRGKTWELWLESDGHCSTASFSAGSVSCQWHHQPLNKSQSLSTLLVTMRLTRRDHAIWYIDTQVIDGLELRRWMGSVDETIVAKHAARMGLVRSACFYSTTVMC